MLLLFLYIKGTNHGVCLHGCCRGEPVLLVKPVPPVEGLEAVDDALFAFLRTPAPGAASRASQSLREQHGGLMTSLASASSSLY